MTWKIAQTIALAVIAVATVAVVIATPASAHECANHDPNACNASDCPEGEDHEHIDYNADHEDYYCRSSSASAAQPGSCTYYGLEHPPRVCRLLEERTVSTVYKLDTV